MSAFSDLIALINLKLPDVGAAITPADIREVLTAMAARFSGWQSLPVIIDNDSAGATFTIDGAANSVLVIRNNLPEDAYAFNPANGTWTFDNVLQPTEKLTFIYS